MGPGLVPLVPYRAVARRGMTKKGELALRSLMSAVGTHSPAWLGKFRGMLVLGRPGNFCFSRPRVHSVCRRRLSCVPASPYKQTMSTPIPYRKMNGLGNEIVVVDLRGRPVAFTPPAARAVRRFTAFDQMMVLHEPQSGETEAFVRIFNADGSEAEACGNGMRCVAWV